MADDCADGVERGEDNAGRREGERGEGALEGGGEGGRGEDVLRRRLDQRLDEVDVVVEDCRAGESSSVSLQIQVLVDTYRRESAKAASTATAQTPCCSPSRTPT